jgi:hypothetical protein
VSGLQRFVRLVGQVSVGLGVVAVVAPRGVARAGGVRTADTDPVLPLLVRLNAARQLALGLALLTRRPADPRRSAALFLPITGVDAAAVLLARRRGLLAPRSTVMALAVLTTNLGIWLAAEPEPELEVVASTEPVR